MKNNKNSRLPLEIERKYLIEYPNCDELCTKYTCTVSEIEQTYLKNESGDEERVRLRRTDGRNEYFHTVKSVITDIKRVELERSISASEYGLLLKNADSTRKTIKKTRYSLPYGGLCFEIDIYPFWSDRAIMEVELESEDAHIEFPVGIRVIREVTGEKEFKNSYLALKG